MSKIAIAISLPALIGQNRFTPNLISGLTLWLDSMNALTVHTASTKVTLWDDLSVSNAGCSQGTDLIRPTYSSSGLKASYPGITFNGSTTFLRNTANSIVANSDSATIFMVGKASSAQGGVAMTFRLTTRYRSCIFFTPASTAFISGNGVDAANNCSVGSLAAITSPFFSALKFNGGGNAPTFRMNGAAVTVLSGVQNAAETGTTGYDVGIASGVTSCWPGVLSEIIVYNTALSAANTLLVEGYLRSKWAL